MWATDCGLPVARFRESEKRVEQLVDGPTRAQLCDSVDLPTVSSAMIARCAAARM